MRKFYCYCVMFLLVFGIQSCDDDPIMKVVFPTDELVLSVGSDEDESSGIITYSIEDFKEGTEIVFHVSDEELWSVTQYPEQQKVVVTCATSHSLSDIVGTLTAQVMSGGKPVTTSEIKLVKKASTSLSEDMFIVTPEVLEAVGGKVPATIDGRFPEWYFDKNAVIEITPVLKWSGGSAEGQPAVFQGENVEGNDQTISYKEGGNYTMKTSFDYVPAMRSSELYLEFKAKVGEKVVVISSVKIANGVIATSE